MATLLFTHPACLEHDPGEHHPESPARLRAVLAALEAPEFGALTRREAPAADIADIARVHPRDFVEAMLDAVPKAGYAGLDADTILSPGSGKAALRAAGAVVAAVDAVVSGEASNAFCAVRPPGHHAEPDRAMGFCLFNNVAIGAARARAVHGLARASPSGRGRFRRAPRQRHPGCVPSTTPTLFYASTHQSPLYPGTGARSERGVGNIVNVPLPPMAGSTEFRRGVEATSILPALDAFAPSISSWYRRASTHTAATRSPS